LIRGQRVENNPKKASLKGGICLLRKKGGEGEIHQWKEKHASHEVKGEEEKKKEKQKKGKGGEDKKEILKERPSSLARLRGSERGKRDVYEGDAPEVCSS